jgi:hypothetical protein
VKVRDRMARALPLLIALLAAAAPAFSSPQTGDGLDPGAPRTGGGDDLLFARLAAARKELVLQEIFEFTLSVYSRGLNLGREIALVNEEAPGLNFLPFQDLGGGREAIDGRVFDVHRFLGRAQAVAAGTFRVQPTVRVSVVIPTRNRGGGSPENPPPGRAEVRQADLRPNALAVNIRPLPEAGKPEGFTGGVGSFTFAVAARPATVAEGEPVTLTVEIRGRGNIESVAAPQARADGRFKIYEPKLLKREIGEDRSQGRLVFEQILVPRSTASTPLPALSFSYFDPARQAYRQIVAGPFPLLVTPAAHPGAVIVQAPASGPEARKKISRPELAPLKPAPGDWTSHTARPRLDSLWFLALLVPPVIVATLYLITRRREELARDVVKARRQLAPQAARSGFGAAEQALRAGDPAGFHEALWEALSSYFGHRFNLLPGEISRDAVVERLARAGLGAGEIAALGEIFRLLEQERFARPPSGASPFPAAERQRLAGLLNEAGRLLQACDKIAG